MERDLTGADHQLRINMDDKTKKRISDIRARLGGEIPVMKLWRAQYSEDVEFLLQEIDGLLSKLQDADILAMTVDVLVQRGILGSRALVGDARLNYGEPWDFEYAARDVLLRYKSGLTEVKRNLSED